ncbi:EXO70A1 [Acrasis kona]|uniref:Exocyst subunit Exo70 family protein n=1 Tax=Acrasis kona TaxID=1008807 RepID=A0AAW2YSQ3_9EUKA
MVKDKMISILDGFESRFSKLEEEMDSMNRRIDVLKLAHDNIDTTIKSVDNALVKYNVPNKVERRLEQKVNNDLDTFLSALDQSDDALQFFTKHQNFKGADKISAQLLKMRTNAVEMLQNEFKTILENVNKKGVDPYNLPQPLEAGIELIPDDKLDRLSKIAARLDSMQNVSYRSFYVETRRKLLCDALAKIYPENKPKMIDVKNVSNVMSVTGVNMVKNAMIGGINKVTKKHDGNVQKNNNPDEQGEGNYTVRSSHKFILYLTFYLKMLEAERRMCAKIVQNVQRNSLFSDLISQSMQTFMNRAEQLANKNRSSEKVFVLLDVLENFEKYLHDFDVVLQNTNHFAQFKKLSLTFKKNISKLLEEFKNEVEKNEIEPFADGAVHQVTTNAFSFMRRLFDYEKTVEDLLQSDYFTKTTAATAAVANMHKTSMGRYIYRMVTKAIDTNIETKSKQCKQKSHSLACVFCLNNDFYVYKKLQNAQFKKHIQDALINDVLNKVKQDEKEYLSVTWDRALSYLNDRTKLVQKKGEYTSSAKKEIKSKLKHFNEQFIKNYLDQRSFSIRDLELKEKVRSATIQTVIPVYKSFIDDYGKVDFSKKNKGKYICYDERTMEDMILQYFDEEREDNE